MKRARSVGSLPLAEPVQVAPTASAGEALERVREGGRGACAEVAVTSGGRLDGVVELEALVRAPPDTAVGALASAAAVTARPDESAEHACHRVARSQARCIWVTDVSGSLVGVVAAQTVAATLVAEHDEDMARLGGYRAMDDTARRAAEEPLGRRLRHRLPWLVIGLGGAMASAVIVSSFEEELSRVVLLSFFVPAVVYMADSVGTQTETVLIRAMAAGVSVREIAGRELATGLSLGVLVALLFWPFAALGWGNTDVALAVSLALLASCSIATAVAMALPAMLQGLGRDPAFGSGPLATVIQDLLSIAIYFAVAVPLAT
jgi:magnesium transporter